MAFRALPAESKMKIIEETPMVSMADVLVKSLVRREQNLQRRAAVGDDTEASSTALQTDTVLAKRIKATMALVNNLTVIQEKIDKRGHDTDFTRLITEYVEEHSLPKEIEQALMMLSRRKVLQLVRNSILFKGIEDED